MAKKQSFVASRDPSLENAVSIVREFVAGKTPEERVKMLAELRTKLESRRETRKARIAEDLRTMTFDYYLLKALAHVEAHSE